MGYEEASRGVSHSVISGCLQEADMPDWVGSLPAAPHTISLLAAILDSRVPYLAEMFVVLCMGCIGHVHACSCGILLVSLIYLSVMRRSEIWGAC